jgi:hypothetical protein
MTWHTPAFAASVTNSLTNTALNALTETALIIGFDNGFRLLEKMFLSSAWSLPNNGTGFRVTSPKFAQFSPIEIIPVGPGPKQTNPLDVASWPYRAPVFRGQEDIIAYVDTGGTASAIETLLVSLQTTIDAPAPGEQLTIKWTSTTAAVANTWTNLGAPTLSITLPEGAYQLVGSQHKSTNAQCHRMIFSGQFYRPGWPSTTAFTNQNWPGQDDLRQGVAGTFSNITIPQVEILANGTDNSHTGFWRVIKVA